MGCVSSTEVVRSHGTVTTKKKLGGAYPGNRRNGQQQPYIPPASDFNKEGIAVTQFQTVGGGNALTLMKPESEQQQQQQQKPLHIQVTVPDGVQPGQLIHVQAPDGRMNEVAVPPGHGPGSTFTVQFAPPASVPAATAPSPNKFGSMPESKQSYPSSEPEIAIPTTYTPVTPAVNDTYNNAPSVNAIPVYNVDPYPTTYAETGTMNAGTASYPTAYAAKY